MLSDVRTMSYIPVIALARHQLWQKIIGVHLVDEFVLFFCGEVCSRICI